LIWHLEEPVADPAAITTYLICREARREMPVMLSGMGGDEIFAGYPRFLAFRIAQQLRALPPSLRRGLEGVLNPFARPGRPGRLRGPRRNLWKFMRAAGMDPLDGYLSFSSYYSTDELGELLMPDVVRREYDPLAAHRSYLMKDSGGDVLRRLLYVDAKTFLPCLNLTCPTQTRWEWPRQSRSAYHCWTMRSFGSRRRFRQISSFAVGAGSTS
jgi:asparagine synthase (glutamine-hydrolysing)